MTLEELESLLKVLEAHGVTRYCVPNGLELELQPEVKPVTLDELLGEKDAKDPEPKNAYEAALERAASQ